MYIAIKIQFVGTICLFLLFDGWPLYLSHLVIFWKFKAAVFYVLLDAETNVLIKFSPNGSKFKPFLMKL